MRRVYNTDDNFYTDQDILHAFTHAYFLGQSGETHDPTQAMKEWKGEYARSTMEPPGLEDIADAVSAVTHVGVFNMRIESGRHAYFALSRHMVSWFSYMYTTETVPNISAYMGYKNHSSVLHGHSVIDSGIQFDRTVREKVDAVKATLAARGFLLEVTVRTAGRYGMAKEYVTLK